MRRLVLTIAGLVLFLIIVVSAISSFWPTQEKRFFELGLLGKNRIADDYFVDANSTIGVGDLNNWFINIGNHMGKQYNISIRAKLINFTTKLPDDQENIPCPAPSFSELPLSLLANETLLVPFSWSVFEIEWQNGSIVIKTLLVNEQVIDVYVSALEPSLRIVFELWVQDQSSGDYLFGWKSENGFFSASVYKGFRMEQNSVEILQLCNSDTS